jgi:hypothetical protein
MHFSAAFPDSGLAWLGFVQEHRFRSALFRFGPQNERELGE